MAGSVLLLLLCLLMVSLEASVIVIEGSQILLFEAAAAKFAPRAPNSGTCGILVPGNPFHACIPLSSELISSSSCPDSQLVLVQRGDCPFDVKIKHAQDAGFNGVIVTDDEERKRLITMTGGGAGITIPAVFISKIDGDILLQHANHPNTVCWIMPSYENFARLVVALSSIFLLAVAVAFGTCFLRRQVVYVRGRERRESDVINYEVLRSMQCTTYQCESGTANGAVETCAICLEDYVDGAKLRVLPCNHRFHCVCIDAWLMKWQPFCPICKRHAASNARHRASEYTPLLRQTSVEEGMQGETSVNMSAPNGSFLPRDMRCFLSVMHLPSRHNASFFSIAQVSGQTVRQSQNNSLEAFRMSPYFIRPQKVCCHSSAPNILVTTP